MSPHYLATFQQRVPTRKQADVLRFIAKFSVGYQPPTYRDIADGMGFKSHNGAVTHVRALERKGYIVRGRGARELFLTERGLDYVAGKHTIPARSVGRGEQPAVPGQEE